MQNGCIGESPARATSLYSEPVGWSRAVNHVTPGMVNLSKQPGNDAGGVLLSGIEGPRQRIMKFCFFLLEKEPCKPRRLRLAF